MANEKKNAFIGRYQIKKPIASGGMGEIFLAHDPHCKRDVALKQIRADLREHKKIRTRFLKEARLASRLNHQSIIPIYEIHEDPALIFYTMPYVEGDTLKHILKETIERDRKGESPHPIGVSIPNLIRIFMSVCQAIDYSHAQNILHRDLKPENIIVGSYGEVRLIDWGLAKSINEDDDSFHVIERPGDLTSPGKVVGTLSYMAPERVYQHPATISSEIYSLGIILYHLLTLKLPFHRPSVKEFKANMKFEKLPDPSEVAPHRDIPSPLIRIVQRATAFYPDDRYQSVSELIEEITRYQEGEPEWFLSSTISAENKHDWVFQENVLLAKHIAITRTTDVMEWVMLMISNDNFHGNIRVETSLRPFESSNGIGFLLNIPEPINTASIKEGLGIWIGTEGNPGCRVFRNNVEVMQISEFFLKPQKKYSIVLERIDYQLKIHVNGKLLINYQMHIPMVGGHIGLVLRDAEFELGTINILTGSQSVMVNCLSVPDAFLNSHDYDRALNEYRKIYQSFRGRFEGREALFRAGLSLLHKAKSSQNTTEKERIYSQALHEFEQLRYTSGAPLEYLGKSLVYQSEGDFSEEIKCLELGVRKYKNHPLLKQLEEHFLYRLNEASNRDRRISYELSYIILHNLPRLIQHRDMQQIFFSLYKHMEIPHFIYSPERFSSTEAYHIHLSILLCFWLDRPLNLYELLNSIPQHLEEKNLFIGNILQALKELGYAEFIQKILKEISLEQSLGDVLLNLSVDSLDEAFTRLETTKSRDSIRSITFLLQNALLDHKAAEFIPYFKRLQNCELSEKDREALKAHYIWVLLWAGEIDQAGRFIRTFHKLATTDTSSPFFFLYGCYLWATEGEEIATIHFHGLPEGQLQPIYSMAAFVIVHQIPEKQWDRWLSQYFRWEKIQFYRQMHLFFQIQKKRRKVVFCEKKISQLFLRNQHL